MIPDECVVHATSNERVVGVKPEFTAIKHRRPIHLDQQQTLTVTTALDTRQLHNVITHI